MQLLEKANEDRLTVIHNLSQADESWTGLRGRLSASGLKELFAQAEYEPRYQEEYFICGPEGLMQTTQKVLEELAVPSDRIHSESFFSAAAEQAKEEAKAGIKSGLLARDVSILVEGAEHLVTVDPGKTILEAGLAAGLNMPYSCQS